MLVSARARTSAHARVSSRTYVCGWVGVCMSERAAGCVRVRVCVCVCGYKSCTRVCACVNARMRVSYFSESDQMVRLVDTCTSIVLHIEAAQGTEDVIRIAEKSRVSKW